MNKKVVLSNKYFLAKGGERDCYIHPNDKNKVIKVVHRNEKHNEQNKLEYKYYKYLKKSDKPQTHLTECFGFINTNLGLGLVYERLRDYNNKPSKSFKNYLEEKFFTKEEEENLVYELKEYLFKNDILFIDVDLSNVFCQEIFQNVYKLIIIDGLGARRLNWRFYVYLYSKIYTRYKISKQWKKFYNNYLKYSTYL
ncbi:YrbL family protein [Malaciobacter canalis]|uniref:YrbL family protein n=1 Tax=Malaciobacter canalis TaxID=1912871 RepID=UPI0038515E3D